MTQLPKKIHVCGRDYVIEIVDDLDGGDSWGRTAIGKNTIYVEKDISPEKQKETLIHEIMHIAYRMTAATLTNEQEEQIIKPWSWNIYGILKDNGFFK